MARDERAPGMQIERIVSSAGLWLILSYIYLLIRRNRRRPPAERFCEAFLDEIQDLSQGKGDAFEFLRRAFPKHETAYLKFRKCLKGKTRRHFDDAWKEYYFNGKENPHLSPEQYFAAGNIPLAKEKRELALRRIRNLLSFAKRK
jgi:hypothetical protein